jgi:hypothetical protein
MQEILARQGPYRIQSVVALYGGMLPDMHRPTLVQQLVVTSVLNSILAYFVTVHLFKKSISKVVGPNTAFRRQSF